MEIHGAVDANYGPEVLGQLGLAGVTPRDPALVRRAAEGLLQTLASPGFTLPVPRRFGAPLDPNLWKETLEPQVSALKTVLDEVSQESREASETLHRRNDRWDELEQTYRRSANLLQALFAYVGLDQLAERVRPTVRRVQGGEENLAVPPGSRRGPGTRRWSEHSWFRLLPDIDPCPIADNCPGDGSLEELPAFSAYNCPGDGSAAGARALPAGGGAVARRPSHR